ncbi:MAG: DUF1844 domain-containing protein [Mailhella sp.]|nr:DUF1844 domain-containing protein [Mailhella sp.]
MTELPEVTFSTFILSLASSASVYLGEIPNPETGKREYVPELAKHTIDLLSMLEDKFANGLTADESAMFRDVLYKLRMSYITGKKG